MDRHRKITEEHIYALQDDSLKNVITEDEYQGIIEEISVSDLTDEDIENFFKYTLPRVAKIDKFGLELVHFLSMQIHELENLRKDINN